MAKLFSKRPEARIYVDDLGNVVYDSAPLVKKLSGNLDSIKEIFKDDSTLILREFENQSEPSVKCCIISLDGMIDAAIINSNIITPLVFCTAFDGKTDYLEQIRLQIVSGNDVKKVSSMKELVEAVLYGDTALLADGSDGALIINTKGFTTRGITEPDDEKSLRGPREGFTEGMMTNLSMIRRKLQTCDLKFSFAKMGTRSNTRICLCYLDSLVDKGILNDLKERLSRIEIDGILDSNYIAERARDSKYSLFKTMGTTEKPDVVAAKLLEGRIAVVVDGTPIALTVPYLFIENFQSPDDYYSSFYYSSIARMLRFLAFFISISVPALYIAFVAYHQEMIPTNLFISIISAANGVPFPIIVECIGMLIIFEILNETGIRMPSKIGQALSIVGALVVGQAAVEAKIVSAPMIIVVAITGISGLMVPRLRSAVITIRFIALMATSSLGLFGYYFALTGVLIYLVSLRSFGIDYCSQFFSLNIRDLKDVYFRAPHGWLRTRPRHLSADEKRLK